MVNKKNRFSDVVMYLSINAREEREFSKYQKEIQKLKTLSDSHLESLYISVKVSYERKKLSFSVVVMTLFISFMFDVWRNLFKLILKGLKIFFEEKGAEQIIAKYAVMTSGIIIIGIGVVAIIIVYCGLKEISSSKRKLLLVESVLENRKK